MNIRTKCKLRPIGQITSHRDKLLFLCFLGWFRDRIDLLLLLKEFLHSSLDDFLDYSILIERWMTLIAGLHFDRTRNGRIYGEFSATDALHFNVLIIISMDSFFH